MWLKLDLDGIIAQLRVYKYVKPPYQNGDEYDNWCKVDFSFISKPWLNYQRVGDEVLLSFEVDELEQVLTDLLNNKLTEPKEIEFIEPDFSFKLSPEKSPGTDQRFTYIQKGCKIQNVELEWQVCFWNGGSLNSNYLSVTLGRNDITSLRNYLLLTKGDIKSNAPQIQKMINNGQLY